MKNRWIPVSVVEGCGLLCFACLALFACGDGNSTHELLPAKALSVQGAAGAPGAPNVDCREMSPTPLDSAVEVNGHVSDYITGDAVTGAVVRVGAGGDLEAISAADGAFSVTVGPPMLMPADWLVLAGPLPDTFVLRVPLDPQVPNVTLLAGTAELSTNLSAVGLRPQTDAVAVGMVRDCDNRPINNAIVIARAEGADLASPPGESELGIQQTYYADASAPRFVPRGSRPHTSPNGRFAVADKEGAASVLQVWGFRTDVDRTDSFEGLTLIAQHDVPFFLGETVIVFNATPTEGLGDAP